MGFPVSEHTGNTPNQTREGRSLSASLSSSRRSLSRLRAVYRVMTPVDELSTKNNKSCFYLLRANKHAIWCSFLCGNRLWCLFWRKHENNCDNAEKQLIFAVFGRGPTSTWPVVAWRALLTLKMCRCVFSRVLNTLVLFILSENDGNATVTSYKVSNH